MSCNGLPADTYDRYVLGLLDDQERSHIEAQIEQQCSSCIRGVQRSMNLWLVYATTLDNTEPSADFRARLVRIADLSKRVLTFPKPHRSLNQPRVLVSSLLLVCCALGILLVLTFISGRYAGRMDAARSAAAFVQLDQDNARYKLELEQEQERIRSMTDKATSASRLLIAQQQRQMKDQLSKAQAELAQLNAIVQRESDLRKQNSNIVETLSLPGARLMQLKGIEAASSGSGHPVAYALIVENSRLIFIGSNLPAPPPERQLQVWILRKEEPKYVSAGLVNVDDKNRAVAYFDADPGSISGVYAVEVTEEPALGSKEPTGPKILESAVAVEESS